jgi:DNA-binding HxlR family transcriptional regulator
VVGISDKMLIIHLKELEADHVVERKDFQEIPPRVEYSLTLFGVALIDTMLPMCE